MEEDRKIPLALLLPVVVAPFVAVLEVTQPMRLLLAFLVAGLGIAFFFHSMRGMVLRAAERDAKADSESHLRAILNTAVDGVISIDEFGIVKEVNPAVQRIFGYEAGEIIGQNIKMLMPEPYRAEHDGYLAHYRQTGEKRIIGIGREVVARRKDGQEFPIDLAVSEYQFSGARMFVGMIRDISERKKAELSLKQSYEEVMRSNRALDEFAYIASHDLKEPLRGIYNFSELLKQQAEEKLDAEGRKKLETIIRLSRKMEARISGLLHYARLGSVEAKPRNENLAEVLEEVLELIQAFLKAHQAEVVVVRPLPVAACSRVAMAEVFQNLITNAVKYNREEHKRVEIGWEDGPSPVFYVRDNGIGIPAQHHETVFRIFKRLHPEDAYGGGTGAGLTFVRRILEAHGGRIWIDSAPGKGSTFNFTLGEEGHGKSAA